MQGKQQQHAEKKDQQQEALGLGLGAGLLVQASVAARQWLVLVVWGYQVMQLLSCCCRAARGTRSSSCCTWPLVTSLTDWM